MTQESSPSIAIVGSGPSGCYTAQFLRKRFPNSPITIYDRLPVPYGLVRFGVAPDHPGTKAVTQQFARLFERDEVKFVGGCEVGTDLTLDSLRDNNDIVVLATGLTQDRVLGIPGEDKFGLYGSGRITRLINGHPDETIEGVVLGENLLIVGHGNVAIDLIRLSLTAPQDLIDLRVDPAVAELIASPQLRTIHVVGRSAIDHSKFDVAMAKELGKLKDVKFTSDHAHNAKKLDSEAEKRAEAIQTLIDNSNVNALRTVNFHFGWVPKELVGSERVQSAVFQKAGTNEILRVDTDAVYTAIGFTESNQAVIKRDAVSEANLDLDRGLLAPGLYCVGWLRRGPVGTIPANRADAKMVADNIISDYEANK